jgi:hypothetical protein
MKGIAGFIYAVFCSIIPVFSCKIRTLLRITQLEVHMTKTQLKALATKIHGLAVKSANGKKPAQNKAIEKITVLLNQAIETDVKQAYIGIASQVRGLAEKLEPAPARKAVKRKKVTRGKLVVAKKKTERRRGRAKPTEKAVKPTETTTS